MANDETMWREVLQRLTAMLEGWCQEGKTWYYLNANGSLKTGWLKDNGGHWYYLSKPNGTMVTGTVPIDGKVYTFNASEICQNICKEVENARSI